MPLRILEIKNDTTEVVIVKESLELISKRLQESGATLVSIVSVMGTYRTGKSFLLDLLARYLKKKLSDEEAELARKMEEERLARELARDNPNAVQPATMSAAVSSKSKADDGWRFDQDNRNQRPAPEWMLQGDSARIHEGSCEDEEHGFAWRGGKDKCTQGIWVWSKPFVFTDKKGRKIALLLMDTQGAGDSKLARAQTATIFGITALLSSKLIYNMQNRIEEDKLENMDYITTFTQTVCSDLPGKQAPFGHLEFLVRDWANYEEGFSLKQCRQQMEEALADHLTDVPQETLPRVERLKNAFRSIHASGLSHPGSKVPKKEYSGEIDLIDRDFLYLLEQFADEFFGDGFPVPSAPLGCEITTTNFQQIVLNFAKAFKDSAQDMAIGLREAFVKVEMVTAKEELMRRFREKMKILAADTMVLDPVVLKEGTDKLLQDFSAEFEAKLKPWRMPEADEFEVVKEFRQMITEAVRTRVAQNDTQVEGATLKLIASPVVGSVGYFLLVHHIVLYLCMGVGGYMHANQWAQRKHTEMWDPVVLQAMSDDAKRFAVQRWKDLQAIQVALNRLNPQDAMASVMKASQAAGAMAQAAAASASGSAAEPSRK
eukprot:TRINITY_DN103070_c0_g1_i1.p1 TRINITY_DN103070_c0_g1~~TRINITY_DN103070_c0_g1_i1.p1  ORF type:complete len:602 (-),score=128.33 TRINITY_DN103070_c0_g1_i1:350-2155(-)